MRSCSGESDAIARSGEASATIDLGASRSRFPNTPCCSVDTRKRRPNAPRDLADAPARFPTSPTQFSNARKWFPNATNHCANARHRLSNATTRNATATESSANARTRFRNIRHRLGPLARRFPGATQQGLVFAGSSLAFGVEVLAFDHQVVASPYRSPAFAQSCFGSQRHPLCSGNRLRASIDHRLGFAFHSPTGPRDSPPAARHFLDAPLLCGAIEFQVIVLGL